VIGSPRRAVVKPHLKGESRHRERITIPPRGAGEAWRIVSDRYRSGVETRGPHPSRESRSCGRKDLPPSAAKAAGRVVSVAARYALASLTLADCLLACGIGAAKMGPISRGGPLWPGESLGGMPPTVGPRVNPIVKLRCERGLGARDAPRWGGNIPIDHRVGCRKLPASHLVSMARCLNLPFGTMHNAQTAL
jgi:hypothetical protein